MSEREVRELYEEGLSFRRELVAGHWLTDQTATSEDFPADTMQHRPADLFASTDRPLVVGLFGGTGVGKSSLLNRLAGAEIARTGVVRPTSMEITVFLHENIEISALPKHFPRENISDNRHYRDSFARIMWVDMPDFDSDETQNREQVTQWLPHIDLLIYVVSPERYKDRQGWQLLLQHGYRHAWLFVVNHWDRAQGIQRSDFNDLLMRTGFESPKIFQTVCSGESHPQDQFNALSEFVIKLSERKYISMLDERGWLNRLQALGAEIDECIEHLKMAKSGSELNDVFVEEISRVEASSSSSLALAFKTFSERYRTENITPIHAIYKSLKGGHGESDEVNVTSQFAIGSDVTELWDEWSTTRLSDALLQFKQAIGRHGYPAARLQCVADEAQVMTITRIKEKMRSNLNTALLKPGPGWQRAVVTGSYYLQMLLPLLVALWIVYRAVVGFIDGASDRTAYVGVDFLVNGLILVGISWLVPWLVARLLKPSIPKSVNAALHSAVSSAFALTNAEITEKCEAIAAEKDSLLERSFPLKQNIRKLCNRTVILQDSELNQLLTGNHRDRSTSATEDQTHRTNE